MADDDWYKPNAPQPPPRLPTPGDRQWTLVKDGRRFDSELRFRGESYGWECQLLENGELRYGFRFPLMPARSPNQKHRFRLLREGWTIPATAPPDDANRPAKK